MKEWQTVVTDRSKKSRWLFGATIVVFAVSTLFPIAAALAPIDAPLWIGIIDVILAASLFLLLILLHREVGQTSQEARARTYEVCRWVAALPLLLFVVFVLGVRIKWEVLLPGLGWRGFYLVVALPSLLSLAQRKKATTH
jgi:hypothetical protein